MEQKNEPTHDYSHFYVQAHVVRILGILSIIFLLLLIVQKGNDLKNSLKNTKPVNTLSTSAQGKVSAVPDLATVSLGVLSEGSNSTEVKDKNNQKVNKVLEFIKSQGVEAKDITTSQLSLYPTQKYENGSTKIVGFQGNQIISVKIHAVDKDQKKLNSILDGAVNNGANEIQGVNLTIEDPDSLKQEARKLAISKAKEKAQDLAKEAGLTLGKVVSVSESGGYPIPQPYMLAKGMSGTEVMDSSVMPNVEPGSQEIVETMSVTFEVK